MDPKAHQGGRGNLLDSVEPSAKRRRTGVSTQTLALPLSVPEKYLGALSMDSVIDVIQERCNCNVFCTHRFSTEEIR